MARQSAILSTIHKIRFPRQESIPTSVFVRNKEGPTFQAGEKIRSFQEGTVGNHPKARFQHTSGHLMKTGYINRELWIEINKLDIRKSINTSMQRVTNLTTMKLWNRDIQGRSPSRNRIFRTESPLLAGSPNIGNRRRIGDRPANNQTCRRGVGRMNDRMPPRLTVDTKKRQQTLDVVKLTANRHRQNG